MVSCKNNELTSVKDEKTEKHCAQLYIPPVFHYISRQQFFFFFISNDVNLRLFLFICFVIFSMACDNNGGGQGQPLNSWPGKPSPIAIGNLLMMICIAEQNKSLMKWTQHQVQSTRYLSLCVEYIVAQWPFSSAHVSHRYALYNCAAVLGETFWLREKIYRELVFFDSSHSSCMHCIVGHIFGNGFDRRYPGIIWIINRWCIYFNNSGTIRPVSIIYILRG